MNDDPQARSRSLARGRPGLLLGTLLLGQMSETLAFTAFVAALPRMAHDFGPLHGAFIAQMTMGVASMGMMLGAVLSGWILERGGTRATLLACLAIFAVMGAAGMVLHDPLVLLATRLILGLVAACMATVCIWGMSTEYHGARRAQIFGVSAGASNFLALGTTVLGGYLAQRGGWSLAFVQYPVFGVLGCLLALASINQVKPEPRQAGETGRPFFFRLLPFFLLVAFLFAVMFTSSVQFTFALAADGIQSAGTRSVFLGVVTVVGALTSFLYGPLQQRLTVLGAFALAVIGMAAAMAIVGWETSPAAAVVAACLMGFYTGVLGPYVYHAVSEATDERSRGRAIGLLTAFGFLGGFLNPVAASAVSGAIGLRNFFLATGCAMLALAVGMGLKRVWRGHEPAGQSAP